MIRTIEDFYTWEKETKDTIDFKRIYADIAGDTLSGLVLSELIFWYLPNKDGKSKLRVYKNGEYWIARQRSDWWGILRLKPKQIDYILSKLEEKNLIEKTVHRFNGERSLHIRIIMENFLEKLNYYLDFEEPMAEPIEEEHFIETVDTNEDLHNVNPKKGNLHYGKSEKGEFTNEVNPKNENIETQKCPSQNEEETSEIPIFGISINRVFKSNDSNDLSYLNLSNLDLKLESDSLNDLHAKNFGVLSGSNFGINPMAECLDIIIGDNKKPKNQLPGFEPDTKIMNPKKSENLSSIGFGIKPKEEKSKSKNTHSPSVPGKKDNITNKEAAAREKSHKRERKYTDEEFRLLRELQAVYVEFCGDIIVWQNGNMKAMEHLVREKITPEQLRYVLKEFLKRPFWQEKAPLPRATWENVIHFIRMKREMKNSQQYNAAKIIANDPKLQRELREVRDLGIENTLMYQLEKKAKEAREAFKRGEL